MTHVCRLIATLVVLALCACATSPDGTISGTRMKLKEYTGKRIGLLPVVLNPSYDAKGLPSPDKIGESIAQALRERSPLHAELVKLNADALSFPLTPKRLADIGTKQCLGKENEHLGKENEQPCKEGKGFQALIGASVIAWSPPVPPHRVRVSLIISFVDLEDPQKKWILSGTWKAQPDELPTRILNGLGGQLDELDKWLSAGLIPLFAQQAEANDPVLTFYSPSTTPGKKQERMINAKSLQLVVSSMDDEGLTALSIRNPSVSNGETSYAWEVPAELMKDAPIYVSSPITVPLAFGSNTIVMSARNSRGREIERKIAFRSLSRRGLNVFAVGVEKDAYGLEADHADDAVRDMGDAAAAANLAKPTIIKNEDATSDRVFDAIQKTRDSLGAGDELLLVAVGRGGISQRRPYLQLFGAAEPLFAEQKSPGGFEIESSVHWLRLEDLLTFAPGYPTLVVLDLCTNGPAVEYTRRSMQAALKTLPYRPGLSKVRVIGDVTDCDKGVGELSNKVGDELVTVRSAKGRTADGLFTALTTAHRELLAWNGHDAGGQAAGQATPVTGSFWAVTSSTTEKEVAVRQADELKARGLHGIVVLGTNGVFNVTLGSFGTYDQASLEIKNAFGKGVPVDTAYVLAPEKVKSTVYE